MRRVSQNTLDLNDEFEIVFVKTLREIKGLKSRNILTSARVYFIKTVKDYIMKSEKFINTRLLGRFAPIFFFNFWLWLYL